MHWCRWCHLHNSVYNFSVFLLTMFCTTQYTFWIVNHPCITQSVYFLNILVNHPCITQYTFWIFCGYRISSHTQKYNSLWSTYIEGRCLPECVIGQPVCLEHRLGASELLVLTTLQWNLQLWWHSSSILTLWQFPFLSAVCVCMCVCAHGCGERERGGQCWQRYLQRRQSNRQ